MRLSIRNEVGVPTTSTTRSVVLIKPAAYVIHDTLRSKVGLLLMCVKIFSKLIV